VPFYYAQPAVALVENISRPQIENARTVVFDQWPKGLKDIAVKLGEQATEQ
jgi:hypothetical protein